MTAVKPRTKIVNGHNFHRFLLEVEKNLKDGYKINPAIAARRSLGQRLTVALVLDETEAVEAPVEEKVVETPKPRKGAKPADKAAE